MYQTTIFDLMYPKYKITKPIRLIETFSGYGSQALALKYLGVEFEHWKTCEWAIKSIQAYKDIHFTNDTKEISMSKAEMIDYLYNKGISSNYNEPMTKNQISRLNEKKLKTIIENIEITHNLVNIQQVKGQDLEIIEKEQYEYIMTYSFPCTDLSLAGKRKGMADTSTRSGMLWEVERILNELKELNQLPQILLMENVPQVHGSDNVEHFNKWQLALERLGYKSYFQDIIATDYGIPQTRNRCFMISILGDYSYNFPQKIPLKLKLKDMLENEVDEKYYLSKKMIKYVFSQNDKYKVNLNNLKINREIACSKTTREGSSRADTSDYISNEIYATYDKYNHKINGNETIATIQAGYNIQNHGHRLIMKNKIRIKNANKKGYLEATDGDGINLSNRMEHQRGNVQKDKIQTLTTSGGNDRSVCVGTYQYSKSDKFMNGKDRLQLGKNVSTPLQTSPKEAICYNDLKIRKLTPRECGRLMGVKDEDIDKLLKNQSDSSAYHLFGDSIIVSILMAIFGKLLNINWIEKFKETENKFIDK